MVLPLYLAMTNREFGACTRLPAHPAWMACHFSPYGTGLTGLPPSLPEDAMVILNDRVPISGHDPKYILQQLRNLRCGCFLLDFQRPGCDETAALVKNLCAGLGRPVGVSQLYAEGLDCPVFLPPVPPDTPVDDYFAPWNGREIWLEAALDGVTCRVTPTGTQALPLPHHPDRGQSDPDLCCHYAILPGDGHVDFHIWRTREDLDELLQKAAPHGVTKAIGLWQELGRF